MLGLHIALVAMTTRSFDVLEVTHDRPIAWGSVYTLQSGTHLWVFNANTYNTSCRIYLAPGIELAERAFLAFETATPIIRSDGDTLISGDFVYSVVLTGWTQLGVLVQQSGSYSFFSHECVLAETNSRPPPAPPDIADPLAGMMGGVFGGLAMLVCIVGLFAAHRRHNRRVRHTHTGRTPELVIPGWDL